MWRNPGMQWFMQKSKVHTKDKSCPKWLEYLQHNQKVGIQNVTIQQQLQRNSANYYDVFSSCSGKTFPSLKKKMILPIRNPQEDVNKIVRGKHCTETLFYSVNRTVNFPHTWESHLPFLTPKKVTPLMTSQQWNSMWLSKALKRSVKSI